MFTTTTSKDINVSTNSNATINAISNNNSYASISVNDKVVTVQGVGYTSGVNVTITVPENNIYTGINKVISVVVNRTTPTFWFYSPGIMSSISAMTIKGLSGTIEVRTSSSGTLSVESKDSTIVEAYFSSTNGYTILNFTAGKNGTTDVIVTVAETDIYEKITPKITITIDHPVRYGVKIDKNNSDPEKRVEYILDAKYMVPAKMDFNTGKFDYGSWKDVWFVAKNRPVMLTYGGEVDCECDPDDHIYKKGMRPSEASLDINPDIMPLYVIQDPEYTYINSDWFNKHGMSEIPLTYLHMYEDDKYEYIIACEEKYDNNYVAIAHTAEDGTIRNVIYLAMFDGIVTGSSHGGLNLLSMSGGHPYYEVSDSGVSMEQYIEHAKKNGSRWSIQSWGQRTLINALLLIMAKNENLREVFGHGKINDYDLNDSYYGILQTGTLLDKGQFYGYNDDSHAVKVFYIENWWGNNAKYITGIAYDSTYRISLTGPYDTTGNGYEDTKKSRGATWNTDGYITDMYASKYGRLPIRTRLSDGTSGSKSTYLCDICNIERFGSRIAVGRYGPNCIEFLNLSTKNDDETGPNKGYVVNASLSYV